MILVGAGGCSESLPRASSSLTVTAATVTLSSIFIGGFRDDHDLVFLVGHGPVDSRNMGLVPVEQRRHNADTQEEEEEEKGFFY